MNECIFVVQICCYSKCGVILEELNPHLPFGDHLLGKLFFSLIGTRGYFSFSIIYIVDEGVQKSGLVVNSHLEGVC